MIDVATRVAGALNSAPVRTRALAGGCVSDVRHLTLADGREVVAKVGGNGFALEGFMLSYLAEHSRLPVPAVLHAGDDLLLMEYLPSVGGGIGPVAEADAAVH